MKKLLIIAGSCALLVLALILGAFFAGPILASAASNPTATSTPSASTNNYCNQFVNDLASRLGVSASKLEQSGQGAAQDVLNQLVKDGKLTQTQANQMKQKLSSGSFCSLVGKGGFGLGHAGAHGPKGGKLGAYMQVAVADVAKGLNLSTSQLQSDLESGKSLSQIASAQNVSSSQLQTIVKSAVQDALNKAVSAGAITQTQANDFMQRFNNNPQMLERLLSGPMGRGMDKDTFTSGTPAAPTQPAQQGS